MSDNASERRIVFYSGRVQNVGFRYTAQHIAQRFAVTGFVRNLPDGRVHLVVEGEPKVIAEFLAELASTMSGKIHEAKTTIEPATGEFDSFEITG